MTKPKVILFQMSHMVSTHTSELARYLREAFPEESSIVSAALLEQVEEMVAADMPQLFITGAKLGFFEEVVALAEKMKATNPRMRVVAFTGLPAPHPVFNERINKNYPDAKSRIVEEVRQFLAA